jgi:RNA polymerase sigma-70 factor (ECF subfamily)
VDSYFPDTRESLLVRIQRDAARTSHGIGKIDPIAWEQFVAVYRPVILRIGRAGGLQEADAEDITQSVLLAISQAIGRWQRRHPSNRFRNWLSRITRNAIIDAHSRRPVDRAQGGSGSPTSLYALCESQEQFEELFDAEYRRGLYLRAARIVQHDVASETWRAFELTVLEDRPVEEAAQTLNKTIGSVYAARSRVTRRLRQAVQELEELES